ISAAFRCAIPFEVSLGGRHFRFWLDVFALFRCTRRRKFLRLSIRPFKASHRRRLPEASHSQITTTSQPSALSLALFLRSRDLFSSNLVVQNGTLVLGVVASLHLG